jgi:HlyD family secretion protein
MKSHTNPDSGMAENLKLNDAQGGRKRRKKWLIAALLLLVVGALIIWRTGNRSDAVQFKTDTARMGVLTVVVTATGTLQPTNKVEVSSELSGILKTVEVDYNDKVKVGQVLARLDPTKLEAQLTQARAALESAKAKALQAQATVSETRAKLAQFHKVRELSNNKVPSQTEMDAAEASYERAKADAASAAASVNQAKATLEANETDVAKLVIRSPIDGIVISRSIEPGQTVASSFQAPVLFTLAQDLRQMELQVDVDEADVGRVTEGQKATFTVDAYPDRIFEARITQVHFGSKTVEGVVTYQTVLKVNNEDLSLRPGMTATADITVAKVENALLVPSAALRFTPPAPKDKRLPSPPSRGLVGALLPRPPQGTANQTDGLNSHKNHQRVWVLKNGSPTSISLSVGLSDGVMTQITAGEIKPGTAVLVDVAVGANK